MPVVYEQWLETHLAGDPLIARVFVVRLDGSRLELPKYGWTTDEIELICNWMIPQNQIGVLDNINRVAASSDTRRLLYVNDKLYLCLKNGDRHLIPRE